MLVSLETKPLTEPISLSSLINIPLIKLFFAMPLNLSFPKTGIFASPNKLSFILVPLIVMIIPFLGDLPKSLPNLAFPPNIRTSAFLGEVIVKFDFLIVTSKKVENTVPFPKSISLLK